MSWDLKGVLKVYEGKSMDGLLTVEGKELNDAEAGVSPTFTTNVTLR